MIDRLGLTADQVERSAWTVDGQTQAGGPRSVALMLAVAWQSRLPLLPFWIPGAPWVLDRVYGLIARHRRRLPGATPWCVAHDGECAPLGS